MGLALKEVLDRIGSGKMAPAYLVFGDDEMIVNRSADKIAEAIVPESSRDINLVKLTSEQATPEAVADELMNMPLFPSNKAVLAREPIFLAVQSPKSKTKPGYTPEALDHLLAAIDSPPPKGHAVVIASLNVDKRSSIYKTISKKGVAIDLTVGNNAQSKTGTLKDEARAALAKLDVKLSPGAFKALEQKTGFDTRAFTTELEKLAAFAGKGSTITENDVEKLCNRTREESIFDLSDAVARKNLKDALVSFKELVRDGVYHLQLLNTVHREFRNMRLARYEMSKLPKGVFRSGMNYNAFQKNVIPLLSQSAGKKSGKSKKLADLHPYVAYKALNNCTGYSDSEITGAMEAVYEIDRKIKTSRVDPNLLMEELFIKTLR